jgi:hypothetical protein
MSTLHFRVKARNRELCNQQKLSFPTVPEASDVHFYTFSADVQVFGEAELLFSDYMAIFT